MNIFELEIWDDECEKCTFYTIRLEDAEKNETDLFFDNFYKLAQYKEQTQELLSFIIEAIGNNHGAVDEIFNRHENQVDGLPGKGKIKLGEFNYFFPKFPIRLYALRITENIIVLFNGGIKDGKTNQTSSLHFKWIEACNYAKRIIEALNDGTITIDNQNRKLHNYDGSDEIVL